MRVAGDSVLSVDMVITISLELSMADSTEYTVAVRFPSTGRGWFTVCSLSYMDGKEEPKSEPNSD